MEDERIVELYWAQWDIWVDGGCFYYCGLNCPDGVKTGRAAQLLYRYDPVTEESTVVWRCDGRFDACWTNGWYLRDGTFYYYISKGQYEDVEPGVCRYDLATMETTKITGCAAGDETGLDSEHIYLMDYDTNRVEHPHAGRNGVHGRPIRCFLYASPREFPQLPLAYFPA